MKILNINIILSALFLVACADDQPKEVPVITWDIPADIAFGTALSSTQLNATADIAGDFVYTPALGAILEEGADQELKVDFTPDDQDSFSKTSKTVTINVTAGSNAVFNPSLTYGSITDIDGNVYKTITIGTQTWMAENLRTTKYQNGDEIPEVTANSAWKALVTSAYCNYENTTDLIKVSTYGRLYNWFAVSDTRNIAPTGWHVATDAEWTTLATFLGGATVAGGKMKEVVTTHWNSPNTGASNSSGFTALPSGRREYGDGAFINMGYNGFWWTNSPYNPDYSWYRQMRYDVATVEPANFHKQYGFSVRCVKD